MGDFTSSEDCKNLYGNEMGDQMFCAMRVYDGNVNGACLGDHGGPILGKYDGFEEVFQVGIVSWGNPCSEWQKPGVYADIYSVYDWIQETIEKWQPSSSPTEFKFFSPPYYAPAGAPYAVPPPFAVPPLPSKKTTSIPTSSPTKKTITSSPTKKTTKKTTILE